MKFIESKSNICGLFANKTFSRKSKRATQSFNEKREADNRLMRLIRMTSLLVVSGRL
jgi:hypothetical protein